MSHPTPTGNGCSLEDCHTNLFALTDLTGIKWRRLCSGNAYWGDPSDDPVLQSFTKCIQSDILCVWRRRSNDTRATDQLGSTKELWIFWYGDSPSNLQSLLGDLQEEEVGSWDNGLPYECRTLLFKALHNLIERCLLSQNFVRLGKWFVQPYDYGSSGPGHKSAHLSIRFSFFLHGESTVCASIDVRQHPPLRRLHTHHLSLAAQSSHMGLPVILGPYGLAGTLTGQSYKDNDEATRKLLSDWKQFYYIDELENKENQSTDGYKVPPVVEVVVAGVRMRYPSCFVLVTAESETEAVNRNAPPITMAPPMASTPRPSNLPSVVSLTPPTSPCDASQLPGDPGIKMMPASSFVEGIPVPPVGIRGSDVFGHRIVEKVWQDSCISCASAQSRHPQPTSTSSSDATSATEDPAVANWDFADPTQRYSCTCSKGRGGKQRPSSANQNKVNNMPASGKHVKSEKSDKTDKPQVKHTRSFTPFHRRLALADEMLQQDIDMVVQRIPNATYAGFKGTPRSGSALPQLQNTGFEQSVDSPHSAAPSPLMVTQTQPAVSQTADPTMPTLSPHPPAKNNDKDGTSTACNTATQAEQLDANNVSTNNSTSNTELYNNVKPPSSAAKSEQFTSPYQSTPSVDVKSEPVNNWLDSQRQSDNVRLKRPLLPTQDHDDYEELVTESLYDFSTLQEWLKHPMKKFKSEICQDVNGKPLMSPGSIGHGHMSKPMKERSPSPPAPPHDPYEFSDESSTNAGNFGKRSFRTSRDDSFSRPSPFANKDDDSRKGSDSVFNKDEKSGTAALMQAQDLVPTINDLDNIFDTDEDNSDPDAAPTPPSNTGKGSEDSTSKGMKGSGLGGGGTSIGPPTGGVNIEPELTRMFPTPPSLENLNHVSPCTGSDTGVEMAVTVDYSTRIDISRQTEETIKDWSYVFKPSTAAAIIGSERYAPIDLPSSKLQSLSPGVPILYRPPWQLTPLPLPIIEKQQQPGRTSLTYTNLPSIENVPSISRMHNTDRMTSIETSPATFPGSSQQRTPMSYELQSPASNASSYMNKTLNSMDNQGTNSQLPEAQSLTVNLALADSILNLFKDHNFDSCTMCACNMNIKGADIGLYLPPDVNAEPQFRCTCGFSAVKNRKYGPNSGLFYEDVVEITGIRDDRLERRKPSLLAIEANKDNAKGDIEPDVPQGILTLLQGQFTSLFPSCTVLYNCWRKSATVQPEHEPVNMLEIQDGCDSCYGALELGRQAVDNCSSNKLDDPVQKSTCLHKWPYLQASAKIPTNSQDVVRLLKSLQPLLQDAIQKKRTTRLWENTYAIMGPLTWKDFHLLAGRGSDEASTPQPIPPLLVGYDKEWLSVSPHALRFWDKLLFEPFGRSRDVAYIVVTPDNEYVLSHVKSFFRELSRVYELCRLGKHVPIGGKLKDPGIMRVGKKSASKIADDPVPEWFTRLGDSPVASKLRLYAQVCKHNLGPYLATQPLDRSLLENPSNKSSASKSTVQSSQQSQPSSQPSPAPPQTPENPGSVPTSQGSSEDKGEGESQKEAPNLDTEQEQDEKDAPSVVVYIVDPFTYGEDWDEMNRLSTVALLRCYQGMLQTLPDHLQNNIHLQMVPLQCILDFSEISTTQMLKMLSFAVYTQSRCSLNHSIFGRSLTGFGPVASAHEFLKKSEKPVTKLFSPPFVIASPKGTQCHLTESCGDRTEQAGLLLCGYCLSEDQRWLLAVCTDDHGEVLETVTINIEIPNRNRRKKASARKIGLRKLWEHILGVISTTCMPWRLVIGRFGRLGHGELKGWAGLLSRNSLHRASKQLRDMCSMCSFQPTSMLPCILSACLVSFEVHQSFHIMADSVKAEEKMSSNVPLNTPRDASCTHILVFPTSATAQANTSVQQDTGLEGGLDGGLDIPEAAGEEVDDLITGIDIDDDLKAIFGIVLSPEEANPSSPGSPNLGEANKAINPNKGGGSGSVSDPQEEPPNPLQQPLAMGYYVSTAKTGPLPKWFWSSCPQREGLCPTCFKAALHVHFARVQQNQDEFPTSVNPKHSHPLDSNLTCDVLRYVLETYNALSWLTLDPSTNDRRSCLPAHFVVLNQLYQAMNTFV